MESHSENKNTETQRDASQPTAEAPLSVMSDVSGQISDIDKAIAAHANPAAPDVSVNNQFPSQPKIVWHKVTWYSRLGGILVLFIIIPILAFLLAIQYKDTQEIIKKAEVLEKEVEKQPEPETHITYTLIKYQSGVSMPTISAYSDQVVMNKVNKELSNIGASLGCDETTASSPQNYFRSEPKVVYNKDDIFSVAIHASYYCGGAYPTNDANLSVTFDMKSGEKVAFEDLFQNYEQNKAKILRFIFADLIKLGENYKGKEQNCNSIYSENRFVNDTVSYGYTVSKEGITVQPLWAHVIEICAQPRTVSPEALGVYLKPNSLLLRVK